MHIVFQTAVFEKMAILVIFLGIGYLCAKLKVVSADFNKGLSKLVVNVLLVGMILASVINKDPTMPKSEMIFGLGILVLSQLISFVLGLLTPALMHIKDGDKNMYRLLVTFPNNGFVGMPLVGAIYGDGAVFFASLSNIPFNLLLYSAGMMLLRGKGGGKVRFKDMINAPIIATLLATVIFLFEIPMPLIVEETADMLSDACLPLSMMTIGLSLGDVNVTKAFTKPRVYGVSFMRLIVVPLVTWAIMRLFVSDPVMLGTAVIIMACPPAIICAILGIDSGRDGAEASEMIFIGTLLSMLTLPVMISVLGL